MMLPLRKILSSIYHYWRPKEEQIGARLNTIFRKQADVLFIEIGANNGKVDDPIFQLIFENKWKGCFVEPQKSVFQNELVPAFENNDDIILVNAAISTKTEERYLYKLNFGDEDWVTALASFNRSQIEKHIKIGWVKQRAKELEYKLPPEREWIIKERVKCISFDDLVKKYNYENFNLLVIDTEGFDYEILKTIDFIAYQPKVVIYEHRHLSKNDYRASVNMLRKFGYKLIRENGDTMAYH